MLKVRRSLTVLVSSALALSLTGLSASADEAQPPPIAPAKLVPPVEVPVDEVPDVARGLIVKTTTATPTEGLLAATDKALGTDADVEDDSKLSTKVATVDFDQVVSGETAQEVADAIAERSDVVWATPNRMVRAQAAPPVSKNDERFPSQRNLWDRISTPIGGYSIKAPSLWRKTEGNPATVVAVIDSGVLPGHLDLAGKLLPGRDMIRDSAISRDAPGRDNDPSDQGDWYNAGECGDPKASPSSWHGTFVAGQIAAATDNGIGIAGVAPGAMILPVRALGKCGGWDSDILAAMAWASGATVDGVANPNKAKIVNMSLAGPPMSSAGRASACRAYSAAASAGNARGAIFIAAAGNDGDNANRVVPASCGGFVSVGATSSKGFGAIYSNIGSTVDLSAPGGDPWVEGASDRIYSLSNDGKTVPAANGVGLSQGTSMAAPQVAGAAALLHGLGFNSPNELTNALYASVSPFRPRNSVYARKNVQGYRYDLNCTSPGRKWCGRGLLDLSRVQAPLTAPVISGSLTIGEPLRTSLGAWVRTPTPKYVWRVNGAVKGTGSVYWPTLADAGKSVTVTIAPSTAAFAKLTNLSGPTGAIAAGPAVSLAVTTPRYGSNYTLSATVAGAASGPVQIRTDGGQVLGTGNVVSGVARIRISGRALKPGSYAVRAAYLGNGITAKASSPRRTVTIRKLTAKVGTKLPKSVSKKKRAKLRVTVTERPNLFASPTGTLRIYDGKKRILISKLSSSGKGKKSIRLPKLKKGTHKIWVLYQGNGYISGAYSSYRKIKVK